MDILLKSTTDQLDVTMMVAAAGSNVDPKNTPISMFSTSDIAVEFGTHKGSQIFDDDGAKIC